MTIRSIMFCILTLVPGIGLLTPVNAQLIGSDTDLDQIVDLNPNTGIGTLLAVNQKLSNRNFAPDAMVGLAYDRDDRILYGINRRGGWLMVVDADTGAGTAIGRPELVV